MELKHKGAKGKFTLMKLLIVPYGIETMNSNVQHASGPLLIVPYGIETSLTWADPSLELLLIVPYGIETRYCIFGTLTYANF